MTAREMDRSWLVQRLKKPHGPTILGADNPFAFGGGLRNGGLSDDAMGLLRGVWSFDYMGAAEFEFGAVPKALQSLAGDAKHLTAFTFEVPLADVPGDWRDKNGKAPDGTATIYALSRKAHAAEVRERVTDWAKVPHPDLKEGLRLTNTLRPYHEWDGDTVGWLELNNGFLFFTDRDMWEQTCGLFGVALERAA